LFYNGSNINYNNT